MCALRAITPESGDIRDRLKPSFDARTLYELERRLKGAIEGEVRFDAGTKAMYAVDSSNYRQVPLGVVLPKSIEDVTRTVSVCKQLEIPLLSRGGGTSLAGQCCNVAVVIDWTKYLHNVLELNIDQKYARVEPGTNCDALREAAQKHGLTWGPDPATHTHCTFGGMLGNNSCGTHAQMAGKAVDNVEAMDILLYDGTRMTVGWMDEQQIQSAIQSEVRVGDIYRRLDRLRKDYAELIQRNYPKLPRRVSGYNLDQLLPGSDGRFNIARALVGSESTCVTILEAKVRLVPSRPERVLVVLGYPEVYQAADHIMDVLEFTPIALEGMDEYLVEGIKRKGGLHRRYLSELPQGKGWLIAEFGENTKEQATNRAQKLIEKLKSRSDAPQIKLYTEKEDQEKIWRVRESGLGATAFVPGEPVTWEGWEDSAVPPEKVGEYLRALCSLYRKYDYRSAMYGHFGHGCIHCRVNFDLQSSEGIRKWRSFMDEATDLIVSFGGSFSGEHGDGQSKAEFLYKMFGRELIEAFREFKAIWDPDWKMNPGKLVEPYRIDQNLRLGPAYKPWEPDTHFKFPNDQGKFSHAALRCVGVGNCRRVKSDVDEDQTMCPSYMVTREEKHSTRGRSHLLWEMLHGDVIREGWRDENVKEALDLCLSCKGCKGDCPVNVDIATYKAEFLSHYWEGRLRPRHAYAFGLVNKWARAASLAPGLVNLATSTPGIRELAKFAAGMPMERSIPQFHPEPFTRWFKKHHRNGVSHEKTVLLFPDTFNNYFFPQTSQAAVDVLEHLGYHVVIPNAPICCGRPLYDYGFLDLAKRYLFNVISVLRPALDAKIPIVVLEPSCWSVLRDEMNEMLPNNRDAHRVMENTFLVGEFLAKNGDADKLPELRGKVLMHAHCHHKAIVKKAEHEQELLRKMGAELHQVSSGCCGMAGSFGFEKDKYDVSVQVGEHALLPAVRKAEVSTVIMADGFSCREQVSQLTNRHPLHLAEVVKLAMNSNRAVMWPERETVSAHSAAIRRSKVRAGLALGAVLGGIGAFVWAIAGPNDLCRFPHRENATAFERPRLRTQPTA